MPLGFGAVGLALLIYGCLSDMNLLARRARGAALVAVIARLVLTFPENLAMLRTSRDEALTDALTGLGNRRALGASSTRCCRDDDDARPVVLALFDLDGFKHYNDTFGHPAGDALLARLGANLRRRQRARPRLPDGRRRVLRAVEPGASRRPVIARRREALTEHGEGFNVSCSYGAVALPHEAQDAAEALRIADQRMYEQKKRAARRRRARARTCSARPDRARPELVRAPRRVAELAEATARRLGLNDDEAEQVRHAAELHDVGKVAIPDAILDKPGPLDRRRVGVHPPPHADRRAHHRRRARARRGRAARALQPRALGRHRLPGRPASSRRSRGRPRSSPSATRSTR